MQIKKLVLPVCVVASVQLGCDAKKSTDTSAAQTDAEKEVEQKKEEIANQLAQSVPSSLVLAVFPTETTSALHLSQAQLADDTSVSSNKDADTSGTTVDDPNMHKSVQQKTQDIKKRLDGEGDCLRLNVFRKHKAMETETCYEFDSDMNPSKFADKPVTFGTKDGKNSAGEACLVAFARGEISDSVEAIDQAMEAISGVVCQAKKAGVDKKLEAGESLDLATHMATAGGEHMKFTTAKLSRLSDDADGNAVYRNEIAFTDPQGRTVAVHLLHSPSATAEKGTIWVEMTEKATTDSKKPGGAMQATAPQPTNPPASQPMNPPANQPGNTGTDPNNSSNKVFATSISYTKETDENGKPKMTFEMRRAAIVNTITPFTEDGLVNYAGLPKVASNSDVHAIKYVAYSGNPETGEGDLSYWQNPGGNYVESARGFLFHVEANSEGILSGCGTSGATADISIRKALAEPSSTNVLKPVRYWHPREDQNQSPDKDSRFSKNEGFFITEQCFAYNPTSNKYEINTAKTTSKQGYDVKATDEVKLAPPPAPRHRFEGNVVDKK